MPDPSVFITDEEDIVPRSKKQHSTDEPGDKKQKHDTNGETI